MSDEKHNYRQELTGKIIDLMERGEAPWQKPWNGEGRPLDMPYNPVSGTQYRGGNAMSLMMKGMGEGYEDPRWMTYKQAASIGAQVRKGEKSTLVEYWKWHDEKKEKDPATGEEKTVRTKLDPPRVFFANVFNSSQIDGLPDREKSPKHDPDWNPVEAAERILENSGADIRHDQASRAFYRPGTDSIHLPERGRFATEMDYYEVAMHEMGHWTGNESRLGRDLKGPFGSPEYAREELRAQMASLFVSAEIGIPFHPERHAAYNKSWIDVLKEDKHEFFRASREAEQIADYVLDFNREIKVEKTKEQEIINAKLEGRDEPALTEAEGLAQSIDKTLKVERATDDAITYTGAVVGETGGDVLVKVGDNRTIAMSKARMEVDPEVGNRGPVGYQQKNQDRAADQVKEREGTLISLGGKAYALQRADEVIADENRKTFSGRIIGIEDGQALMSFGRNGDGQERAVAHDMNRLSQQPQVGQMVEINYSQPPQVLMKNLSRGEERSQGKGLGIV